MITAILSCFGISLTILAIKSFNSETVLNKVYKTKDKIDYTLIKFQSKERWK